MNTSNPSVLFCRQYFPRGLSQPKDGFRFSADALLLACFAGSRKPLRVLDLGTGCGVVGLGLLLIHAEANFTVMGVDHDPSMIQAAKINAAALGFEHRFTTVLGNVAKKIATLPPGRFDLVLCNPPYRQKGRGRMPADETVQSARFETSARIEDFIRTATLALDTKGRLAMIHLPENLHRIFSFMHACKLEPKRLRFVHGHQRKPASLLLVEARKTGRPGLRVEPPLVLYHPSARENALTEEALEFCPFLKCNASRPG
ncbi:MAG TPA: methyltransferase domain-containing protein [Desulfonatronum sp.]|nr:methyltransferase domain-containing protein [Desulfonatronum sp.]